MNTVNIEDIRLKSLGELSSEEIFLLGRKFNVHKFYVQSALSMTIIHHLGYESEAENIIDAKTEYDRFDGDPVKQRASVRRIIELAVCEKDILEAFHLATNLVEEKMCVRKLAELLFFKEKAPVASLVNII